MKRQIFYFVARISLIPLVASQIYPGSYELNAPALSESGSSENGHCLNVSDSGRVCNAPRSSVLFDGIPTLTGLEGDMWASQLLTLNTSTSSASITFDFTNPTDQNGPTAFAGVQVFEVVMVNCPGRGIGTNNVQVSANSNSFGNIAVSDESCDYLVRGCNAEISAFSQQITLSFNKRNARVYIAGITFYSTTRQCSPVGPLSTAGTGTSKDPITTILSTSSDSTSSISSDSIDTSDSTNTANSANSADTSPPQPSMSNGSSTVVVVVVVVVLVAAVLAVIVVIIAVIACRKRWGNKPQASSRYPDAMTTFSRINENGGGDDELDKKFAADAPRYSIIAGTAATRTRAASSHDNSQDMTVKPTASKPTTKSNRDSQRKFSESAFTESVKLDPKERKNTSQGKRFAEPTDEAPPAIPDKSEELEIYLEREATTTETSDIYSVPSDPSKVSSLTRNAIPAASFSSNPLYTGVGVESITDDMYAVPEHQQSSAAAEVNTLENIYESIYSESLQPSLFMQHEDEVKTADDLCPYSSIYTVPVVLTPQEKPLMVTEANIRVERNLGSGQFGEVILARTVGLSCADLKTGNSTDKSISVRVAIKMLKADASEASKVQFEKEYRFMFRLNHPNVIRMLGICTDKTPFIMMEYMEHGDLHQILNIHYNSIIDNLKVPGEGEISQKTLTQICANIASGMSYLASNNFVHRDVAARNCLIGEDFTVKIADFGMSRSLYDSHYYVVKGRAILPIRWMAVESFYGKFSAKTDVWAFGCTMWEVFSLAKEEPYSDLSDQQLVRDALRGPNRTLLTCPKDCPQNIFDIMKLCWAHDASKRATFEDLRLELQELCVQH